jgi:hypothetical protein
VWEARWGRKMHGGFWVEILTERDPLEELGVDESTTLT